MINKNRDTDILKIKKTLTSQSLHLSEFEKSKLGIYMKGNLSSVISRKSSRQMKLGCCEG